MENTKMDPDIKAKWVAALRSGKYSQGQGGLRVGENFCCLGVLCDAAELGRWEPNFSGDEEAPDDRKQMVFDAGTISDEYADDMLPDSQLNLVGLSAVEQEKCWRMNDDELKSFTEIADYIEKNL